MPIYVGRKKECGCAVAACVDDPSCADDVAEMVRSGYIIERVSDDEARAMLKPCPHKQQALILEEA